MRKMAERAKLAIRAMARATSEEKEAALLAIIRGLERHKETILAANRKDIADASGDRLSLEGRLEGIIADIRQVIDLKDPVGELFEKQNLHGLEVEKQRTPIGVLGVIYESRPNVTIDVSVLAIKSGNCAILRGGKEALRTNIELAKVVQEALVEAKLPVDAIQLVPTADRSQVNELLRLHDFIDLIIPRGGQELHRFCRENSTIPVITGGIGICHLFVDKTADLERSLLVVKNAKMQRPTVCNALDTLLVHEEVAARFIPQVLNLPIHFRLDAKAWAISHNEACKRAVAKDWDTEWLSLLLGIKVVKDLEEAILHIQAHSTGHSDGILTETKSHADRFVKEIDSAAVYVNASTRFTDGGQLGLGAEVAISTQKLHARGPMGLKELTSYKWVIRGDYAIRS